MTTGKGILIFRQSILTRYAKSSSLINITAKSLLSFIVLSYMTEILGQYGILSFWLLIPLAIIIGYVSIQFMTPLILMIGCIQILSINLFLGLLSFLGFVIIYILFLRLYPVESAWIIGALAAFSLGLEYVIPLLGGLFGSIICIVPMLLGILIYFMLGQISVILQGITTQEGLEKVVQSVLTLASKNFVEDLNLLVTLCVFAIIFLVVWGVSKLRIDYARYVATTIGGVGLILGFGLASLFLEIQVDLWHLIGMTLVGIALALIAAFFRRFVNYAQAQNVQFEDENNYYYVKIVPKVVVKQSERLEKIYTTSTKEQGLSQ